MRAKVTAMSFVYSSLEGWFTYQFLTCSMYNLKIIAQPFVYFPVSSENINASVGLKGF